MLVQDLQEGTPGVRLNVRDLGGRVIWGNTERQEGAGQGCKDSSEGEQQKRRSGQKLRDGHAPPGSFRKLSQTKVSSKESPGPPATSLPLHPSCPVCPRHGGGLWEGVASTQTEVGFKALQQRLLVKDP